MTKRQAKIEALKIIGNSYMILTETNIYEEYSESEAKKNKKINKEIENICFDLLDRAERLENKN
jgi:hypothetical protein